MARSTSLVATVLSGRLAASQRSKGTGFNGGPDEEAQSLPVTLPLARAGSLGPSRQAAWGEVSSTQVQGFQAGQGLGWLAWAGDI